MNKLVLTQLVGTVIGVVVGLVLASSCAANPSASAIPPATKVA